MQINVAEKFQKTKYFFLKTLSEHGVRCTCTISLSMFTSLILSLNSNKVIITKQQIRFVKTKQITCK